MAIDSDNWTQAKNRLYQAVQGWENSNLIITKTVVLEFELYPLVKRFESGERSEDLYHAIMAFSRFA